ncbi:MAG: helix-turn-helix domain-containing protein [Aureispira sp.]
MFIISRRITDLRKEKGWSQGELSKLIGASRDMVGKYERGENLPSVEMAIKLADILEVSTDYLLGQEQFGRRDKEAVDRLQEILNLDADTRERLYDIIDTYVRDYKTRQAHS